jgi:hypothetical protein
VPSPKFFEKGLSNALEFSNLSRPLGSQNILPEYSGPLSNKSLVRVGNDSLRGLDGRRTGRIRGVPVAAPWKMGLESCSQ